MTKKDIKELAIGVGFLLPNILGFLAFTVIPLVMSIYMAFTDWNLEMHNYFRSEPITFVWFENFTRLFSDPDFPQYFGNTFFMMIGIPFGVAGSLVAALLLNMEFVKGDGKKKLMITMILTAVMVACFGLLAVLGLGGTRRARGPARPRHRLDRRQDRLPHAVLLPVLHGGRSDLHPLEKALQSAERPDQQCAASAA